ncbi:MULTISPECIES: type II toxin-antitoxin system PemK/MazF family toxin [Spirulina sp. CCY15215]|uniref:type II toxin-antitoxin system PemK/MazF family toxin n=1 Tax=Spirulina sp. CCY15215 TaxID=2767591 RepID=UPI00194DB68E|nr:type II toxin-antitoxin system PemK/MazF family toxin [Spirulina major]
MTKGKIVLVSFIFDDLSSVKVRPSLCLTDPIGKYNHVILALITSQIPKKILDTDYILDNSHPDFLGSGLKKSSTIKLEQLMTIRISIISRELGQLSSKTQNQLAEILCKVLET